MKTFLLILIFNSCLGQYPDLQINQFGKVYNANQDSTKYYFEKFIYYTRKMNAEIDKMNETRNPKFRPAIKRFEDSCRKYKELLRN